MHVPTIILRTVRFTPALNSRLLWLRQADRGLVRLRQRLERGREKGWKCPEGLLEGRPRIDGTGERLGQQL
jgi:hypothetical protein